MTSGYMDCPKCVEKVPYAHYELDEWTELPEPWECPKCKSLIITDKAQGYGLRIIK